MKKFLNLIFCIFFIIIINSSYVFAMNVNTGGDDGYNNDNAGNVDNQWYSWCPSKSMDFYTNINDCKLDWTNPEPINTDTTYSYETYLIKWHIDTYKVVTWKQIYDSCKYDEWFNTSYPWGLREDGSCTSGKVWNSLLHDALTGDDLSAEGDHSYGQWVVDCNAGYEYSDDYKNRYYNSELKDYLNYAEVTERDLKPKETWTLTSDEKDESHSVNATKISKVYKNGTKIYDRHDEWIQDGDEWKCLNDNDVFMQYGRDSWDYDGTLYDGDSENYIIEYEVINNSYKDHYTRSWYVCDQDSSKIKDDTGWVYSSTIDNTYTITGSGSDTLAMNYKVEVPLTYTIYRPWDLNTMQPADEDYIIDEGGFSDYKKGAQPLEIIVDNFKGITDGTVIPGIDVNTKIPFKIYFKNDSFGIPEDIQNKTFNDWEIKNLDYSNSGDYSTYTQKINSNNSTSKNLSVNYTNAYCQGNPTFDITPANNTSITDPSGNETTSKISFNLGFRGGTFNIKAIKKGIYSLTNGDDGGFTCVSYNKKVYVKQGMKYNGTYTVDNRFGEGPSIEALNDKIKLTFTNVVQPVVKGDFIIDSVAGY